MYVVYAKCIYIILLFCFVGSTFAVFPPLNKRIPDDPENIGDFDDDIAAEVAAAMATAKTPVMLNQQETASSLNPHHSGIPDFEPSPTSQKDNDTYSASHHQHNQQSTKPLQSTPSLVNDFSNNDSGINDWILGLTCTFVFMCVVGIPFLVVRRVIREADVLNNYKGWVFHLYNIYACTTRFGWRVGHESLKSGLRYIVNRENQFHRWVREMAYRSVFTQ